MKKIAILLLPLILFIGFLAFKPPALASVNTPATDQVSSDKSSIAPQPEGAKKSSTKQPVIKGRDDDEDHDRKPSYGGHDDDDYDD